MAIDFPNSPNVNDEFTVGDRTWRWDGTVWSFVPSGTEVNVASELLPIVLTPNPPRVDIVGTAPVLGFNDDGREFVATGDRHVIVFDNDSLGDRAFDTQLSTVADSYDMGPATFDAVASAESWGLVGGRLTSPYPYHYNKDEEFGRSVAMSGDGTRVIVGGIYMGYDNATQFVAPGGFRVYEQVGNSWSQLGSDFYGDVDDDWFGGGAVAISRDGTRIAAAATSGSVNDYVRVYEYDTNTSDWVQMGSDIDWTDLGTTDILSIALSSDGSRLITGSGNSTNTTYVRAYDWNGTAWAKLSTDITGVTGGGLITDVQVSDNGNRVILGASSYDGVGTNFGRAQVFDWSGSAWSQVGTDIDGSTANDDLGQAVDISADGSRIAVSAPQGFTGSAGYIQVYDWSGSAWVQVGSDIVGTVGNDQFGWDMKMSGNGSRIVQTLGANTRYVSVFEYNGSAWVQLGSNIDGETYEYYKFEFAFAVDISTDGSRVVGTDLYGYSGGHGLVYEYKLYNNLWTDSHYPYHDLTIDQQIQFTVASGSTGYDTTTTYYVAATPGPDTFQLSTSPDSTTLVAGTGDSTGDWYYKAGEVSGFAIKTGIPHVDGSVYRMYISGGNYFFRPGISLGEANDNPLTTVHVRGGSSGRTFADTVHTLVVENHNHSGIGIYTPRWAQGYMQFGDNDNAYIGGFRYRHLSDAMYMRAGGVDHLTLTSVGNLEGNAISWSPTFSNLTLGTSTVTAFYHQVGGYVHWSMKLVFGSGFSWSSGTMVLGNFPVSAADSYEIAGTLRGYADDVSVERYYEVYAVSDTTTSVSLRHVYTDATPYLDYDPDLSSNRIDINDPFSWVSGDILFVSGTYRAA